MPLAILISIVLEFHRSNIEYVNPLTGFGPGDTLDDIQQECFSQLEELGKKYPLAYKIAGELHLGSLGRIYFHKEKALKYFKLYANATGDTSIIDDYDNYTNKMWKDYLKNESKHKRDKYLNKSNGITYSHDPLYYENNH